MNLHEYQAKSLFSDYGIPTPAGRVIDTLDGLDEAVVALSADRSGDGPGGKPGHDGHEQWAVKAQVHAGGRGARW